MATGGVPPRLQAIGKGPAHVVLDTVAEVFVRGGYEGTSIDDLVKSLDLHRGSLYPTDRELPSTEPEGET